MKFGMKFLHYHALFEVNNALWNPKSILGVTSSEGKTCNLCLRSSVVAANRNVRIILFTYPKIEYVELCTYLSKNIIHGRW